MVYAGALRGAQLGQRPRVHLPIEPSKLRAFCVFSGLDHLLNRGQRPSPDHRQSETVPLRQFYQAVGDQAAPIVRLVRRHLDISPDTEFYLGVALSEAAQNIEDHARSNIGGVWCARYLSGSKQVRVAVVDHGVGITASLASTVPDLDDVEALRRVVRGGVSSKSLARNMGLGISNLCANVKHLRGDLAIVSGAAAAVMSAFDDPIRFERLGHRFPGTALFFRLNVIDSE